jgi:hypothetical protein
MHTPFSQQLHSPSGQTQLSQQPLQQSSCTAHGPSHPTVAKTIQSANRQAKILFIINSFLNRGTYLYTVIMKKLINKKHKKKQEGKCYLCGTTDYELLDVHRIKEGADGGKYTDFNSLVVCVACHRKIHAGKIQIHGRYFSTAARYILHFTNEEGEEVWG